MIFLVRQFSLVSCCILGPDIRHSILVSNTLCKPHLTFVPHSATSLPPCFNVARSQKDIWKFRNIPTLINARHKLETGMNGRDVVAKRHCHTLSGTAEFFGARDKSSE